MSTRQFVAVKFRKGETRTYTYHNDGEPVAPGDQVKVAARSGDGWSRVFVDSVSLIPPRFTTKAIIGRIEPEAEGDLLSNQGGKA